jgi:regulator of sigma E protease
MPLAAFELAGLVSGAINILIVAVGIGLVIFVHELGHFLVAKWCGVRCDKFYLGFDVYGLKLASFRWGETEYGIGLLPLGGYVKMLGQEDSPAAMREEIDRAKQASAAEGVEPAEQRPLYDPRSYQSKSVLQRMAIISAGVVMNVIFALIVFIICPFFGESYIPSIVGSVSPGSPAWNAGLATGDEIVEVNGLENPRFMQDFSRAVVLGNFDGAGIPVVVKKADTGETVAMNLMTFSDGDRQMVGVRTINALSLVDRDGLVTVPGSAAAKTEKFQPGDRIVAINGETLEGPAELSLALARQTEKPVTLTVERKAEKDQTGETLDIEVAPNPFQRLGLRMQVGPILDVRKGSVADKAGLKVGDTIVEYDGQPIEPFSFVNAMSRASGEAVDLVIRRQGAKDTETVTLTPGDPAIWLNSPDLFPEDDGGVEVGPLGLVFQVKNTVADVLTEGIPEAAMAAKLAAVANQLRGKTITKVTYTSLDEKGELDEEKTRQIGQKDGELSWVQLWFHVLQADPAREKPVFVTVDGVEKPIELSLYPSTDTFQTERGLIRDRFERVRQTDNLSRAFAWGWRDTKLALMEPYRVIHGLFSGRVGTKLIGGPIKIFAAGSMIVDQGLIDFFLFLALLSANLAVINFLPIPVLDGGHMVFLGYEAVRGKPPSENVQITLQFVGLFLLLALFVFVFFQDSLWLWDYSTRD